MTPGQQRLLSAALQAVSLPVPAFEVEFAKPRKFRADALWERERLALEVDGGYALPGGGRHTRVAGFLKDLEKHSLYAILGYRLIRVAPKHIQDGTALAWITQALRGRSA